MAERCVAMNDQLVRCRNRAVLVDDAALEHEVYGYLSDWASDGGPTHEGRAR